MFITAPGETDVLMVAMAITLALVVVGFGVLFLRLHTLPERVAHKGHKIQFEIVAILGLIALFTHMHIFWVAGLLLAFIDIPDFGGFLGRIAGSVEKNCRREAGRGRRWRCRISAGRRMPAMPAARSAPRKPARVVAGKKELDHA